MQTFLPYPDFAQSAKCLDRQRLGKQRVEALQIVRTLRHGGAWQNHPAVRMWRGHENALIAYGVAVCDEWIERGYKDTCRDKLRAEKPRCGLLRMPPWMGLEILHQSHRANLLRKMPEWYGRFWEEDDMPYYWPVAA